METPREHERASDPDLQKAFGVRDDEFEILLGDGSDERLTQLAELSLTLVGHIEPSKRAKFLRSEVPVGVRVDKPLFPPRQVPLEAAAEPNGLETVIRAARLEASRLIDAKRAEGANAPVPEAKRK